MVGICNALISCSILLRCNVKNDINEKTNVTAPVMTIASDKLMLVMNLGCPGIVSRVNEVRGIICFIVLNTIATSCISVLFVELMIFKQHFFYRH
jgi:hypothetical protein